MSVGDKIKHAAEDLKGKAKEATGKVTGNDELREEGRADQEEAHAKHAADRAKESLQNLGQEAKGKVREVAGAVTGDDSQELKGKGDQLAARGKEHLNR